MIFSFNTQKNDQVIIQPTFNSLRIFSKLSKVQKKYFINYNYKPGRIAVLNSAPELKHRVNGCVGDLEKILKESDSCGVGFIANLHNEKTNIVIKKALRALCCMEHRGGCSSDYISGDGAGLMTQIPWKLFKKEFPEINEEYTGVGMLFIPNDENFEKKYIKIINDVCNTEKFDIVGWRNVPVDESAVGVVAKATMPRIRQIFINSTEKLSDNDLERKLYIVRKLIENKTQYAFNETASDFYICTLSNRTIVYKGMLQSSALSLFYKDLQNDNYLSSFVIYHRRFSTNTTPKWSLAQPLRFLGHNGEINTLQGNINWICSREYNLQHPVWNGRENEFFPLCNSDESDSANLDHIAEFMVHSDINPAKTLMILVPEAYRNHPDLLKNYPDVIPFYEFYEGLQEGWDGPALLIFSDGIRIGARLDRNGLRPARYWKTSDGFVYVASEVGILDDVIENAKNINVKERLGPGQMVYVDLQKTTFMENSEIANSVASEKPYSSWIKNYSWLRDIAKEEFIPKCTMDDSFLLRLQSANGMGLEDLQLIVHNMASTGSEPTFCMGDDIPLSVLSNKPQIIYNYFKQRFAQVTNPPIDPLREGLVMSLEMRLGARENLLDPNLESCVQLLLKNPIMFETQLDAVYRNANLNTKKFKIFFNGMQENSLKKSLKSLCYNIAEEVKKGSKCIILTDKFENQEEMKIDMVPIPSLLALGAVHHYLIKKKLRSKTSIVVETAQCFTTHHLAVLIGYGAHAVCPYLAFETCRHWRLSIRTANLVKSGSLPDISLEDTQKNYQMALQKGLLKIMSKMGISLLSCYHGAQIFEIYGLNSEVVSTCFSGSVSRYGGLSLEDLQHEAESLWIRGFPDIQIKKLIDYGFIQSKPKGEYHANSQTLAKLIHSAVGLKDGHLKDKNAFKNYIKHLEQSPLCNFRDCLELDSKKENIPVEEVESVYNIMSRFCTGGMSLGAISRETHETIAIAMNRIGGKSNSGEGGEDPERWKIINNVKDGKSDILPHLNGLKNGDIASSAIKQVASGRFGVTPEFLVNAEQLEIKIAQGAKPGEGGQLPGKKVSPYIASLRKTKPGVPLISPPPHHDIYSIEDLAQLIYDLHMVNKNAKVSVKLVAESGIGTVASGVAKANADIIQISGHDGGTGASPISSIKHAGGPAETGLAEVHHTLVQNKLRDRVVLRVDGGIRSGRDILILAALGADEFGFGTISMITSGCIMARVCHTNNCPVGVATQREDLRSRFPGVPSDIVNFFELISEEVRMGLAELGLKSLDDLIGHSDFLKKRSMSLHKTNNLDLGFLTKYYGKSGISSVRINQDVHSQKEKVFDDILLEDEDIQKCIHNQTTLTVKKKITNVDRSTFGRISGFIARLYGENVFKGCLSFQLKGSAGQSFGCFLVDGIMIHLEGEANDYVGKGMSGGEIVIIPPKNASFVSDRSSIIGNTCLYGATGGKLFVNGKAGERFAVRNSSALAVVEGVGDHCCEYMTGGCIVVLGSVGRNVGAGMTGGIAYIYDDENTLEEKINSEIVEIQKICTNEGEKQCFDMIKSHFKKTQSNKAKNILEDWEKEIFKFWQLVPPSEKNSLLTNPKINRIEHLGKQESKISSIV